MKTIFRYGAAYGRLVLLLTLAGAFLTGCREDFCPEPEDIELIEYSRPKDRPKDFIFLPEVPAEAKRDVVAVKMEDETGHRSTEEILAMVLQLRQVAVGVVQAERLYRQLHLQR